MRQFNATVAINRAIAPEWMHMAFEWPSDLPAPKPGQFFTALPPMVELRAGTILRRPFAFAGFEEAQTEKDPSMLSRPAYAHSIYQVRGPGTRALASMQPGSSLDIIAPLGNAFPYPERGERAIIAGGGIGIGPMLFLAEQLGAGTYASSATLVLGFRSASLIPFSGSFSAAGLPSWKKLLEKAFFSTDDGSAGTHGTVRDALEALWLQASDLKGRGKKSLSQKKWHLYGCGPGPMLASLAQFAAKNHMHAHFSAEQWMACGVGACHGCVLPAVSGGFLRVCADGPVFDARTIDWEASLQ
jgi:dihydroorotate dehydrogenase electron transfer subunit